MEFKRIFIYRMTHIKNIPHILSYGITHETDPDANPEYKAIGDKSLIENRKSKKVLVDNGNILDLNVQSIILGDFIPFYFGVKMPMLYIINQGGNFVKKAVVAENIVYLACRLKDVVDYLNNFYFTNGHATSNYTEFYNADQINRICEIVDWEAVKSNYWGGMENLNIKRKKQAEFLSGEKIPSKLIHGYVCFNEKAQATLKEFGISDKKIKVFPSAYF